MNSPSKIRKYLYLQKQRLIRYLYFLNSNIKHDPYLSLSEIFDIEICRNSLYDYFHSYFYKMPNQLKKHRQYFVSNDSGRGEQAFHAMWWKLFREFKPKNCLEIGVFRGQTISLWQLTSKMIDLNDTYIAGISPFDAVNDSVSSYKKINYIDDIKQTFKVFELKNPELIKSLSQDEKSKSFIRSRKWDLIYIDGCHDYEVVKQDWEISVKNMSPNGIIVLDDSSLYTDYKAPKFAFQGHPGPSKIFNEACAKGFVNFGNCGHLNLFKI